jgi:phosphate-selective porin
MKWCFLLGLFFTQILFAQTEEGITLAQLHKALDERLSSKWYEKINLRGYAQFRYNRLGETNRKLTCTSCDRSIGDRQGFFMRRARLIFFGQASNRIFFYIQPDYATDAVNQNYFQIRDAYFDYHLNEDGDLRLRAGISKVPYGFENLQSSSNRAPLDRNDAMNSGVPNERDTGLFLMFAPIEIRKRFKELQVLKGSGDYGVLTIGAYNGQTLNRAEQNNDLHRLVRLTYPWKLDSGQFIEASVQAYEGKYFVTGGRDHMDSRQAASFIFYPQPFGFQAEYTLGRGPQYDRSSNKVTTKNLRGGYVMIHYQHEYKGNRFFPFIRYQEYEGARKLDNAALSEVREWELGTEWQPNLAFELTLAYVDSERLTQSSASNRSRQTGNLFRLQAQFNY